MFNPRIYASNNIPNSSIVRKQAICRKKYCLNECGRKSCYSIQNGFCILFESQAKEILVVARFFPYFRRLYSFARFTFLVMIFSTTFSLFTTRAFFVSAFFAPAQASAHSTSLAVRVVPSCLQICWDFVRSFGLIIALNLVLVITLAPQMSLYAQGNTLSDAQAERLFAQGNDAYKNANYKQATVIYEQLVQNGVEAAEVYFNLGNCYYKSGKIASAILNYHRAQRLDPTDDDIEFNLSLAESRIPDKIDPAPQFFIVKWWRMLVGLQIASVWSGVGVGFLWLLFLAAGVFFVARSPSLKKAMFVTGIISAIIIALMFIFAYRQHKTTMRDESAIVFASSVSVKSEPQEESKDLFTLHEGTHIEILGGEGVWCKVRIADGSVGWLRRNTIQII